HNALDNQMREELYAALDGARDDVAVIVRGEGPSFCSGGDLDEFGTFPGVVEAHAIRLGRSLALLFAELGPRMVAGIHGACLGAGIELTAFASRVVAADNARVGLPEGGLGLIPGAGGTVSLRRRSGTAPILQLLLTGEPVDASTALSWGLVDEVVPPSRLVGRLHELAGRAA
ncbi:MAG: enoyl-CoA hydratase/isomerase family protein, partial [Acidimicrobiales bacterium]